MSNLNLVPAIRQMEKELDAIKARHRMELREYEDSLRALRKINTACEHCNGRGEVFRRSCAEDEGDYYRCEHCHGTGQKPKDTTQANQTST